MEKQTYEFDIETKTPLGLPVTHGLTFFSVRAENAEAAQVAADEEMKRFSDDGNIRTATMRAVRPLVDGDGKPIVFIEFHQEGKHGWKPHSVITQDGKRRTEFDFDWCAKDGILCSHESGGGPASGEVALHPFCEPENLPGLIWRDPEVVKLVGSDGELDTETLKKMGYRLSEMMPANPFDDSVEGDTEWCIVCDSRYPSDDTCDHIVWNEELGFDTGCGHAETQISEVQSSMFQLLAVLPPRFVDGAINELTGGGLRCHGRHSGEFTCNVYWRTSINMDALFREHEGARRYSPALTWLQSLNKESKLPNALTLGWLWQFKHSGSSCHTVDGGLPLCWHLDKAEMDEWLAIDPMDVRALKDLILPRKFESQSANDQAFLRNPWGTTEVILWPKEGSLSEADVRLSVAQVTATDEQVRLVFGRITERNGKHVSSLPGYDLCEFK